MAYATLADLLEVIDETTLIRLTDDAGTGSVDTGKVERALIGASSEIDGYIGGRCNLPLATVPEMVKDICLNLTVLRCYSNVPGDLPESVKENAKTSRKQLSDYAEGKISLGIQPAPTAPDSGDNDGGAKYSGRTQVFSETELDKF